MRCFRKRPENKLTTLPKDMLNYLLDNFIQEEESLARLARMDQRMNSFVNKQQRYKFIKKNAVFIIRREKPGKYKPFTSIFIDIQKHIDSLYNEEKHEEIDNLHSRIAKILRQLCVVDYGRFREKNYILSVKPGEKYNFVISDETRARYFARFCLATYAYKSSEKNTLANFKKIHEAIMELKKIEVLYNKCIDHFQEEDRRNSKRLTESQKSRIGTVLYNTVDLILAVSLITALALMFVLPLSAPFLVLVFLGTIFSGALLSTIPYVSIPFVDGLTPREYVNDYERSKSMNRCFFKEMGPIMESIEDVVSPANELQR